MSKRYPDYPESGYLLLIQFYKSIMKRNAQGKFLLSILKTHFQGKSVVPADSSPVILVLASNELKNQLLTFPNKSITLEQLSAI